MASWGDIERAEPEFAIESWTPDRGLTVVERD